MSQPAQGPAVAAARRVARPRSWSVRSSDLAAIVVGNGLLIAAMWVRHGGLAELDSAAGFLTAAGQLSALFGTYLVLIQLVLMSRSPWLDQLFGMDRLAAAHRWVGFACVWLLVAHGALTTVGYGLGDGRGVVDEAWTLVTTYPFVLWAVVGLGLFVAVAVSSMRAARRRLSYETWHALHLYAYLAVALTFAHQLVVGADFADDPVARLYWIGLYVVDGGGDPRLPVRPAGPGVAPPSAPRRQRRPRGPRRRVDLPDRSRARPPRDPFRAVPRVPLPHP